MNHLRQRSVWRYALALGCLVSVLLFSIAAATHTHNNGATTSSLTQDCRLCAINGTNSTAAVSPTVTLLTLCLLFVPPALVDLPFASSSRASFSSRAPPLLS
ncbi:MAG: hypothetical protein HOP18_09005 [Deltaproteobacteria bacterium]|nr:hypothetical protein [Deltaproteobacteria bacterium]